MIWFVLLVSLAYLVAWFIGTRQPDEAARRKKHLAAIKANQHRVGRSTGFESSVDDSPVIVPFRDRQVEFATRHDTPFIGHDFYIDYRSRSGEVTNRKITIEQVYRDNHKTYVVAYCHLRHDNRTFQADYIQGFLVDAATGKAIDPDALNPLQSRRQQAIDLEDTESTLHLQLSNTYDGWVVHHPANNVSTKADRKKHRVICYEGKVDAFYTAVNLAADQGKDTLYLYQHGDYQPHTMPKNAGLVRIVYVNLLSPEGLAKLRRARLLKP